MTTVGIIGCGFVGGALKNWLDENNKDVKVVVSDPPKGMNDDISGADVYFVQIHVPTEDDGTQDLTLMKKLISDLPDILTRADVVEQGLVVVMSDDTDLVDTCVYHI